MVKRAAVWVLLVIVGIAVQGRSVELPIATGGYDHPPLPGGCPSCHQRAGIGFRDFNKTCVACHADKRVDAYRYAHEPTTSQVCTSCHKLHQAPEERLLRQDPITTCLVCHDDRDRAGSHPVGLNLADRRTGGALTCTSTCHDPHGSDLRGLTRMTGDRLCFTCHDK